jgi:hypothetical protein
MVTYALDIDYRAHPELYAIGRGEQGVLTVQPYVALQGYRVRDDRHRCLSGSLCCLPSGG